MNIRRIAITGAAALALVAGGTAAGWRGITGALPVAGSGEDAGTAVTGAPVTGADGGWDSAASRIGVAAW